MIRGLEQSRYTLPPNEGTTQVMCCAGKFQRWIDVNALVWLMSGRNSETGQQSIPACLLDSILFDLISHSLVDVLRFYSKHHQKYIRPSARIS